MNMFSMIGLLLLMGHYEEELDPAGRIRDKLRAQGLSAEAAMKTRDRRGCVRF